MKSDQAEEEEQDEEEIGLGKVDATPEKQRAEEPVAATSPTPPSLPLTSFKKSEVVYGNTLHIYDGTQFDGDYDNDKPWQTFWRDIVAFLL